MSRRCNRLHRILNSAAEIGPRNRHIGWLTESDRQGVEHGQAGESHSWRFAADAGAWRLAGRPAALIAALIGAVVAARPPPAQRPAADRRRRSPRAGVAAAAPPRRGRLRAQARAAAARLQSAERPQVAASTSTSRPTAFDANQRALVDRVSHICPACSSCPATSSRSAPTAAAPRASSTSRSPAGCVSNTSRRARSTSSPTAQSVVVRDRKLDTQDLYPLSQTPLRFLLADRIDLLRDTNVVGVYADDMFVTIVIEEKQPLDRHQPADDDVRRQGLAAQAVDRDRSAGLRHHRRGLQSRHQAKPDPAMFMIDLRAQRAIAPLSGVIAEHDRRSPSLARHDQCISHGRCPGHPRLASCRSQ